MIFSVWRKNKWLNFNFNFLLSGFLLLVLIYFFSIYGKYPVYFFFFIPSIFIYIVFVNLMYMIFVTARENNSFGLFSKFSNENGAMRMHKILVYLACIFNVLVAVLFVVDVVMKYRF